MTLKAGHRRGTVAKVAAGGALGKGTSSRERLLAGNRAQASEPNPMRVGIGTFYGGAPRQSRF